MANFKLDTAEKSQVHTPPAVRRTIYDAHTGEIIWKSFLAGLALGIGNLLATVLFFGIIAGILLSALSPVLDSLSLPTEQIQMLLDQTSQSNQLVPSPASPTAYPTVTTTPTTPTTTVVGE